MSYENIVCKYVCDNRIMGTVPRGRKYIIYMLEVIVKTMEGKDISEYNKNIKLTSLYEECVKKFGNSVGFVSNLARACVPDSYKDLGEFLKMLYVEYKGEHNANT